MSDSTRVERYPGPDHDAAQARFTADARDAAAHGWYPVGVEWTGTELVVTFSYGSPAPPRTPVAAAPPAPAPQQDPASSGVRVAAVGIGVALLAFGAVLMIGSGGGSPAATPVVDSRTGPTGFRAAWCAALDDGLDIGDDLTVIGAAKDVTDLPSVSTAARAGATSADAIVALLDGAPRWQPTATMVDNYYAWASTMSKAFGDVADGADQIDETLITRGMSRMTAVWPTFDKTVTLFGSFSKRTGFACDDPIAEPSISIPG